jgi:Zn finger protein HypA/HybF involved in hydrogenase expression
MKNEKEKEFVCRKCSIFLDSQELENGCCPSCETDSDVFLNDLEVDFEEEED